MIVCFYCMNCNSCREKFLRNTVGFEVFLQWREMVSGHSDGTTSFFFTYVLFSLPWDRTYCIKTATVALRNGWAGGGQETVLSTFQHQIYEAASYSMDLSNVLHCLNTKKIKSCSAVSTTSWSCIESQNREMGYKARWLLLLAPCETEWLVSHLKRENMTLVMCFGALFPPSDNSDQQAVYMQLLVPLKYQDNVGQSRK